MQLRAAMPAPTLPDLCLVFNRTVDEFDLTPGLNDGRTLHHIRV